MSRHPSGERGQPSDTARRPPVRPAGAVLREGRLISREDILEGAARAFPDDLPKLFTGGNVGKLMLAVR
ncbi:MAG TPA: hypothetical protein VLL69_05990 [Streptosporangiaceae bacterium]|nr:hypothetical protein [Streptosporangiaceae bacterium]